MKKATLLDFLQQKVGCAYLSDMRGEPYNTLAKYRLITMDEAKVTDFSVKQWNEAITYLSGKTPQLSSVKEVRIWLAYQQLISLDYKALWEKAISRNYQHKHEKATL